MNSPPAKTFYKRVLPSSCTAFSSKKGKHLFSSALHNGGLKSFFALMEQHTTQVEPAYCGLSTLVVALNAFAVDPRQSWKGPWRWYHEEILNCCLDLEEVKSTGITLPDFACLAICQGLSVDVRYAQSKEGSVDEFRKAVQKACVEDEVDDNDDNDEEEEDDNGEHQVHDLLIVSYNRKVLGQTGTGHFSPIAAYDPPSDHVLILDTARFKYGSHWVPLPLLHEAMVPEDPSTGRSRGFVLLSNRDHHQHNDDEAGHQHENASIASAHKDRLDELPVSILFQYKFNKESRQVQADFFSFMESHRNNAELGSGGPEDGAIEWHDVYNYWTRNGVDRSFVWQMLEPQFKPLDTATAQLVDEVIDLIRKLMPPKPEPAPETQKKSSGGEKKCATGGGHCRPNHSRTLPLFPAEAVYIVFLSVLGEDERRSLVGSTPGFSEAAKEQLLAGADLIETVIKLAGEASSPSSINKIGVVDVVVDSQ